MTDRRGTASAMLGPARLAACWLAAAWLPAVQARAQESPSYRLTEQVLNAAGHPESGTFMSSAGFRIRLDALGEGAIATGQAGASFKLGTGFGTAYLPPGEVRDLRLIDAATLAWAPEPSAGDYNLYRGFVSDLPSGGYGTCLQNGVAWTSAVDAAVPAAGTAYFYLATVENLIDEEGTKGFDSLGNERPNAVPCP